MAKFNTNFYHASNGYPSSALPFYKSLDPCELFLHLFKPSELKYMYADQRNKEKKNSFSSDFKNKTLNIFNKKIILSVDIVKNILDDAVLFWDSNKHLKNKVLKATNYVQHKLSLCKTYDFIIQSDYTFVLISDNIEFGYPHTNSIYIFLPITLMENETVAKLAEIIFHEMIHIFQKKKCNYFIVKKICESFGFFQYPHSDKKLYKTSFINNLKRQERKNKDQDIITAKKHLIPISNPDTFKNENYFYYDTNTKKIFFFVLCFDLQENRLKRETFEKVKLLNETDDESVFRDFDRKKVLIFLKKSKNKPRFPKYIGQYEHPFEYMACLWSHLLFSSP